VGFREVLETVATIVVAVVWFVAFRPVALGGPASYIVVRGYSMSGSLAPGDLVVTFAQDRYSVGDAIVYHAPAGAGRGLLVVHRIVGADPSGYRVQGDANAYQDPWQPRSSDVVGRLVLTVPRSGRVLASLANPFVLSIMWGLAALIVGLSFLPDSQGRGRGRWKTTVPTRGHLGHPLLDAATALAVSLMVGLVLVSAAGVISPAHATSLTLSSHAVTARVAHCPSSPPFAGTCS
jgi:signal peptidase